MSELGDFHSEHGDDLNEFTNGLRLGSQKPLQIDMRVSLGLDGGDQLRVHAVDAVQSLVDTCEEVSGWLRHEADAIRSSGERWRAYTQNPPG